MQLSNPIGIYVPTVENAAHHWDKSFQKNPKLSVQTISNTLKSKDFNSTVI
jgi:hypothetical protein